MLSHEVTLLRAPGSLRTACWLASLLPLPGISEDLKHGSVNSCAAQTTQHALRSLKLRQGCCASTGKYWHMRGCRTSPWCCSVRPRRWTSGHKSEFRRAIRATSHACITLIQTVTQKLALLSLPSGTSQVSENGAGSAVAGSRESAIAVVRRRCICSQVATSACQEEMQRTKHKQPQRLARR